MFRYFIQLAYSGTRFHGWQIQPNALTVQEEVNKAATVLTGETVNVVGAGRTDTGVHASFFVAHFDLETQLDEPEKLGFKMNAFLSPDIRVDQVFEVDSELHARFSALSRTYHYYISRRKELFRHEFTAYFPHQLDVNKMNEAANVLMDYSDFTSFSKLHTDVKTNNCKVSEAFFTITDEGVLVFKIVADRFLRNMVRAVVGTLLEVGKGKLTIEGFRKVIEEKNRSIAGASVMAKGLFLSNICYPDSINSKFLR